MKSHEHTSLQMNTAEIVTGLTTVTPSVARLSQESVTGWRCLELQPQAAAELRPAEPAARGAAVVGEID